MPTKDELELKVLETEIARNEAAARAATADAEQAELELRYLKARPEAGGVFTFVGPVTETAVHRLMDKLEIWSNAHPGDAITIAINSQGGAVMDGFALYDYIQTLKKRGHRVTTVGLGMVASMGGILLQAGDERVMSSRCWLLIHEVQGIVAGSFAEMEDDMKFNERLQNQSLDILCRNSTFSRKQIINRWKRKDWWLDANEALKGGFIDRIEED